MELLDHMVVTVFFFLNTLFIYLAVSGLSCRLWDFHCGIRDLSLWCTDSLAVVRWLLSTQAQQLQHVDFVTLWHVGS